MNQAYCYWMWKNNQIHSKMSTLLRKFLYKPFLTENERENFHFSDIKFCQPLGADGFGTVYVRSIVGQKYAVKHLHNILTAFSLRRLLGMQKHCNLFLIMKIKCKTNRFAKQMAFALANLHKTQIVHLDLKPSNIMASKTSDLCKITDFGSCKDLTETSPTTSLKINVTGKIHTVHLW